MAMAGMLRNTRVRNLCCLPQQSPSHVLPFCREGAGTCPTARARQEAAAAAA